MGYNKRQRWIISRYTNKQAGENVEPIFLVYMHINKHNGHVYVGITHHMNPNKRWGYFGQKYTHCRKFLNAIHKYGWNNFDHLILCRTTKNRAVALEKALIAHYKRLNISYNLSDGGEGAEAITELNKIKLRERMLTNHPMKGKHHTLEARRKISEANKKRVYTEEQKRQIANAGWRRRQKGVWRPSKEVGEKISKKLSKPVLQLTLDGMFVQEFSSTIAADEFINNGKRRNHIADVCNGKRKSAHGYKWIYKTIEI